MGTRRMNAPLPPRSPYAVAKAAAFWQVNSTRAYFSMPVRGSCSTRVAASTRAVRYQKVVAAACRIAGGSRERLRSAISPSTRLGMGAEYVEACGHGSAENPPNVFARWTQSLSTFVDEVFAAVGLSAKDHVEEDRPLCRVTSQQRGDSSESRERLVGPRTIACADVAREMVSAARRLRRAEVLSAEARGPDRASQREQLAPEILAGEVPVDNVVSDRADSPGRHQPPATIARGRFARRIANQHRPVSRSPSLAIGDGRRQLRSQDLAQERLVAPQPAFAAWQARPSSTAGDRERTRTRGCAPSRACPPS